MHFFQFYFWFLTCFTHCELREVQQKQQQRVCHVRLKIEITLKKNVGTAFMLE